MLPLDENAFKDIQPFEFEKKYEGYIDPDLLNRMKSLESMEDPFHFEIPGKIREKYQDGFNFFKSSFDGIITMLHVSLAKNESQGLLKKQKLIDFEAKYFGVDISKIKDS